jgi:exosome complex exonuclease DIS3/RRP44
VQGLLTEKLCSLRPNIDRLTFSVVWEVTSDARIVDVKFHKSVIHSIAALTYQQAQEMLDDPKKVSGVKIREKLLCCLRECVLVRSYA